MPPMTQFDEVLKRFQGWCAREERCVADIRLKARSLGVSPVLTRRVIEQLRKEGFINELRYSRAFCRGKFLMNHWGRNKIIAVLRSKGMDSDTIEEAMREIDPAEYSSTLLKLIRSKMNDFTENSSENRQKTARYLIQKGYEPDLVWRHLNIPFGE
jgi:regulatory protein